MFCYQPNFFSATQEVDEARFWALVRATKWNEIIAEIRACKQEAAKLLADSNADAAKAREQEAVRLKKKLPAFIFQAKTFDVTTSKSGRTTGPIRKQSAVQLNGLCVLDIDHVDNPADKYGEWNDKLLDTALSWQRNLGILLIYVTPSGHGLKVVFKADAKRGNLIDNQRWLAKKLGVEIDESCKDASRMSFICTEKDILYINEKEIFTYENQEFIEKYNESYRRGDSQPTLFDNLPDNPASSAAGGSNSDVAVPAAGSSRGQGEGNPQSVLEYHGVPYSDIVSEYLGGNVPGVGDRHSTMLRLAKDLRYICDRNPQTIKAVLAQEKWVQDLIAEGRAVEIEQTIKDACDYKYFASMPKKLREALEKVGAVEKADEEKKEEETTDPYADLPLADWGAKIEALKPSYPCLSEALVGLHQSAYPAGLFASAAFLGTLMTRTWYHFYHRPEEARRLNYCVMIIGDPGSGKSFATRLHNLIAAPIITADKVGFKAVNQYKEETRTKGSNKEKPKKPVVIIRDHPARTANGVFITDMCNAVETIDGQPMHLHMLTFDSELDNATLMQKGGQWIDKSSMELKAFHNEEDGQSYANLDSYSGPFNVYWNYVYTGTPNSLGRKVTERNFGSGLATRLAVIPLPPSGFEMMANKRQSKVDHEADVRLKEWAFKLDKVKGELPLWPLVDEVWDWTNDRMEIAKFNQDKADELLLKRVAYYGLSVSTPFILMRHWDDWSKKKTFEIDDTDRQLCRLVCDIQYRCQHHFFGGFAKAYFENLGRDASNNRSRESRYDVLFRNLPSNFSYEDLTKVYGIGKEAASMTLTRLCKQGAVERISRGNYRKIKTSLM